ncbi:hypothetical protein CGCVW01_v001349 [Colletotrichum viniferum]|nr:hypothetical protein CGCVW01_v001349 [Colletotrichum viniferum]
MIRRTHELAANWVQGWIPNFLFGSILIAIPRHFIAGFIAAWWQSLYGGFDPAGSLLVGLQRLGMIIEGLGPFAGKNMSLHTNYCLDAGYEDRRRSPDMLGVWFCDWIGGLISTSPLFGTI